MRKTMILAGAVALFAPSLSAQQVRWNDRPTTTWSEEAPRVRLTIDGPRGISYGSPVRIRFEVSENAYAAVVRVDGDGRMQILFPYSRNQRAAVRGGQINYVRTPRIGGEIAFFANDRMSGYIFAIASYAPLDFSSFENRDYHEMGGWSAFTVANRTISRRPDVFIDKFAARVLWDPQTPYDYDVDYYHPISYPSAFNAYGMCSVSAYRHYFGYRTTLAQFSSWERTAYPYAFMCADFYDRLMCFSWVGFMTSFRCGNNWDSQIANGPTIPVGGNPTDSANPVPNEGVVRGGLFAPTPVPVPVNPGGDPVPLERPGRFDRPMGDDLEGVMSIPARATRKMKEDDARREKANADASLPARTGFDRADVAVKPEKGSTADADGATRVQPPSREPTKAKGTSDTNRDNVRTNRGYGNTGRTSGPRTSGGTDRVSRPVDKGSTGVAAPGSTVNPPVLTGGSDEKKKPPQPQ